MKCANCGRSGELGKDILFKADGMIPSIAMKKYQALCPACVDKTTDPNKQKP